MAKGIYCLVLALDKDRIIPVRGKKQRLPAGFYAYVDYEKNNLKKRHLQHASQKNSSLIGQVVKRGRIINFKAIKTGKRIECSINKKIQKISNSSPGIIPTKCDCESHLHYFEECPLFLREFHEVFEELDSTSSAETA